MKKIFVGTLLLSMIFAYSYFNGGKNTNPNTKDKQNPTSIKTPPITNSRYKDGIYTGDVTDAFYGNVQIQTTITNGKITDIQFLQYPNDRKESILISNGSIPQLKQEAIQAQNANVDIVTGATQTSQAFMQSLQSALTKAQNS